MLVPVSTKISKEDKERIHALVNKGTFASTSDFYRMAIHRFLREIDEYQEKRKQALKEAIGLKPAPPEVETDEKDLEELQRFVDDLY
ncbi:MAG: hypothetical protein ACE5G7_00845 [Candidatus Hydrothermarchaeaceae archaeon]